MERFLDFLKSITSDEKTVIYAILLTFPLAYTDCWFLSSSFTKISLFSQIALVLGVDIILVAGGVLLDLIYTYWIMKQSFMKLRVPPILFASIIESVMVIFHIITVPWQYIALFGIFVMTFLVRGFFGRKDTQTIGKNSREAGDEQSNDATN